MDGSSEVMEALRRCYKDMAATPDVYPHAHILENFHSLPGRIFDEVNREIIVTSAEQLQRSTPAQIHTKLFRWRTKLSQLSTVSGGSPYHYLLLDLSEHSVPSTWIRGILKFYQKQLQSHWEEAEEESDAEVDTDATNGGGAARTRRPTRASGTGTPLGSSTTSSSPQQQQPLPAASHLQAESLDMLNEIITAYRSGGPQHRRVTMASSGFLKSLRSISSLVHSLRLLFQLSPALFSSCSSTMMTTSGGGGGVGSQGAYRSSLSGQDTPTGASSNPALDLYVRLLREEMGSKAYIRHLLTLQLGLLHIIHQQLLASDDEAGGDGAAAKVGKSGGDEKTASHTTTQQQRREEAFYSFASTYQLLEWITGPVVAKQTTQLLALLFIQDQCGVMFPHEYYRQQLLAVRAAGQESEGELQQDAEAALKQQHATLKSPSFTALQLYLTEKLPRYLTLIAPLAHLTRCQDYFTTVVLLQLLAVPYASLDAMKGLSKQSALPPLASPPTNFMTGVAAAAAASASSPIVHSPQFPIRQLFLYHIYYVLFSSLLVAFVEEQEKEEDDATSAAAAVGAPQQQQKAAMGRLLQLFSKTATQSFHVPVVARLFRWQALRLGDQPTIASPLGRQAYAAAMKDILHLHFQRRKAALLSPATSRSLEDQLSRLLRYVMRVEMALWSLLGDDDGNEAATAMVGTGGSHHHTEQQQQHWAAALREGVIHLYGTLQPLIASLQSSASAVFSTVVLQAIHHYLLREESGVSSAAGTAPTTTTAEDGVSGGTVRKEGQKRAAKRQPAMLIRSLEGLRSLLRLSRCGCEETFARGYTVRLLVRLYHYPDPTGGAGTTRGVMMTAKQIDDMKRRVEGRALHLLDGQGSGAGTTGGGGGGVAFNSMLRYQQAVDVCKHFAPRYITIPSDRCVEKGQLVFNMVHWRQWKGVAARLGEEGAEEHFACLLAQHAACSAAAAEAPSTSLRTDKLPLPEALVSILSEVNQEFVAAHPMRGLVMLYSAALSSFTLTVPVVSKVLQKRILVRVMVHTSLYIHRLLLVVAASGARGVAVEELAKRARGTAVEEASEGDATSSSLNASRILKILHPFVEKYALLSQFSASTSNNPTGKAVAADADQARLRLNAPHFCQLAAKAVDASGGGPPSYHQVVVHWPKPAAYSHGPTPVAGAAGVATHTSTGGAEDVSGIGHHPSPGIPSLQEDKLNIFILQLFKQKGRLTLDAVTEEVKHRKKRTGEEEGHDGGDTASPAGLPFPVTSSQIKKSLEHLIQMDLLKRLENKAYEYVTQ